LKAPDFLVDIYYDLRDRRLLPLLALVAVAAAAVPFLLGDPAEESPLSQSAATGAGAEADEAEAAGPSSFTVVEARPGLRDYRKRFSRRTPTDPFKQRFSGPMLKGAKLNSTSESSSSSTTSTSQTETGSKPSVTPTAEEPASPGGSPARDGSGTEPDLTLFTFAIKVQISHTETTESGGQEMGEAKIRDRVLPATPLPGQKAPVVTYMGMNFKTEKALLMVSPHVSSVFGDAKCVSGTDTCQLLEAEPGFPLTFVYGANDVRYKIKVIKVFPVLRDQT
jgi:hypothetical protein